MAFLKPLGIKRPRKEKNYPCIAEADQGARIKVLATGCSHCSAMRDNVKEAVRIMELPEGSLECISDFKEISRLGVMTTPSLIIDGKLVSAGKVLKVEQIIALIKELFAQKQESNERS